MQLPFSNVQQNSVSVIIPTYNSSSLLIEAVESALNQTYPDTEIIVVDDGSTDDTKLVCERYPTVKYVYQSNQGVAMARNTGIRVSQGAYLIFLDSDDCLLSDAVETGVNCATAHPDTGFVFCSYLFKVINPDGSYTTRKLFDQPPAIASYRTILAAQHKIQCATALFRRSAIESVGGFEPSVVPIEDLNLFLRVARRFPIYFHDRVISEYRYHGGNVSSQAARMLVVTLRVYNLEWIDLHHRNDPEDLQAYDCGRAAAIKFFGDRLPYEIMRCLQANNWVAALGNLRLLLNYDPHLALIDREVYTSAESALRLQLQQLSLPPALLDWQAQLRGAPVLSLPTDRPRLAQQSFEGKSRPFELDLALTTELNLLSQDQGVSLSTTLLAAFKTLLYRYTGSEDLIVGIPTINQVDRETFVNAVALRSDLTGNPQFQALMTQVQRLKTLAQSYQAIPIELLEGLQLYVTFVFEEDLPFDQIELSRLTAIPWTIEPNISKFDLTLYLKQTSQGLAGQWVYSTDLFDPTTIDRLNGHFQQLLTGIIANPHQSIGELPLLTVPERQQLLVDWNDTQADYPDRCIHQLVEEQAAKTPDAIAVVCGSDRLTYTQLNLKSNQLAHHLQSLGVNVGSLVGICVERCVEMVVGLLGILKAGGTYVPLDPSYPQERLSYLLADSKVKVLLTQSRLLATLPTSTAKLICLDTDWDLIAQQSHANPATAVTFADLAYVIYTSGSTGKPKGVKIYHRGFANYLNWAITAYAVAEGNGAPVQSSIAFDATITSIFSPLLVGQTVVLLPEKQEIEALVTLLQSCHDFSLIKITPAHLEILKHLLKPEDAQGRTKALIVGGEALLGNNLAFWRDYAPQTRIINEYGPTETVVGCCVYEVTPDTCLSDAIPIGRPIANTQLYILDRLLQPVPIGIKGELYIGGDGVAQGYLGREDLTTERFIPDPFSANPDARLYKTGDLARYLPDGNLDYLGRIDDQVKIRGFRIELGEIEAGLSQHPDVEQSSVIVQVEVTGDQRLVAYVVTQNSQLTIAAVHAFLAQQLPRYMLPTALAIVDTLPLTVNGKVDRVALLAQSVNSQVLGGNTNIALSSQPEADLVNGDLLASNGSSNSTVAMLVTIWSQVLGLKQVGIDQNFFELGGHSISILQVAAGIQQQLGGIEISVVKLFQYPTIAKLAAYLDGAIDSQQSNQQLKNRAQQQKLANARRRR